MQITTLSVGMLGTQCYIVFQPERQDCVVIDPGAEPETIRRAVGDRRIAAILLTHGHLTTLALWMRCVGRMCLCWCMRWMRSCWAIRAGMYRG